MSLDLNDLVRRLKPDKHRTQLHPRRDETLRATDAIPLGRVRIVPDTNVYINDAADLLSADVEDLFDRSEKFHCSVCLAELTAGIGAFDPGSARWAAVNRHYTALFSAIPPHRVLVPDADIWAAAGMISGMLARTQGFDRSNRMRCLNDTLILLTAAKAGLPVLTADRDDFDLIQQTAGTGVFLYY